MANFCSQCGSSINATAKFCTNCGQQIRKTTKSIDSIKTSDTTPHHESPHRPTAQRDTHDKPDVYKNKNSVSSVGATVESTNIPSASISGDKSPNKIEGILAWLTLAVFIGVIYNLVQLLGYPSAFQELEAARDSSPALVTSFIPALWFEVVQFVVLASLGLAVLFTIFKRKRLAKVLAIVMLTTVIILGAIDYAWVSSIANQYQLDLSAELGELAGGIGRSVVALLIFGPYLLLSKRVKETLTE